MPNARTQGPIASIETPKKGKKMKKSINLNLSQSKKQSVSFVCLTSYEKEEIPLSVVV
jgi:hypothetical protein